MIFLGTQLKGFTKNEMWSSFAHQNMCEAQNFFFFKCLGAFCTMKVIEV